MLIHPDDFHRLEQLDRLLAEAGRLGPGLPSKEALRAHREEGTAGEPITDLALVAKLLG